MLKLFAICILFGLLLGCQCLEEQELDTSCVEDTMQDSNDVDNAISSCYVAPSDEPQSSSTSFESLKDELRLLNEEYDAALKKASRDAMEMELDELDGVDDVVEAHDVKPKDPFFWGRRRSARRRSGGWFRRRHTIRKRTWRRRAAGRPGNPRPNGCSIPLGLYFPYKVAFTPSCNKHDICYYREFYSRLVCDNKFYQNMLNKCNTYGAFKKFFCRRFASIYYRGVRIGGKSHYG